MDAVDTVEVCEFCTLDIKKVNGVSRLARHQRENMKCQLAQSAYTLEQAHAENARLKSELERATQAHADEIACLELAHADEIARLEFAHASEMASVRGDIEREKCAALEQVRREMAADARNERERLLSEAKWEREQLSDRLSRQLATAQQHLGSEMATNKMLNLRLEGAAKETGFLLGALATQPQLRTYHMAMMFQHLVNALPACKTAVDVLVALSQTPGESLRYLLPSKELWFAHVQDNAFQVLGADGTLRADPCLRQTVHTLNESAVALCDPMITAVENIFADSWRGPRSLHASIVPRHDIQYREFRYDALTYIKNPMEADPDVSNQVAENQAELTRMHEAGGQDARRRGQK